MVQESMMRPVYFKGFESGVHRLRKFVQRHERASTKRHLFGLGARRKNCTRKLQQVATIHDITVTSLTIWCIQVAITLEKKRSRSQWECPTKGNSSSNCSKQVCWHRSHSIPARKVEFFVSFGVLSAPIVSFDGTLPWWQ